MTATWLAFKPGRRGAANDRLGAHKFNSGPRSICGYAKREKAGGPADPTARKCVWCVRVESGMCPDQSGA